MAIAHLCLTCGTDLARTRPMRDPHYGLPIVICPACGEASVRRTHPIWTWWKNFRRLDAALRILATQAFMAAALGTFSTLLCITIIITFFQLRDHQPVDHLFQLLFWTFGVAAPVTGMWLTAGFRHLPPVRVWSGWWLCLIAFLLVPVLISASVDEMPPRINDHRRVHNSMLIEGMRLMVAPGMLIQTGFMMAALVGIPFGKLLLWLTGWAQRMVWRMRRRRRRIGRVA